MIFSKSNPFTKVRKHKSFDFKPRYYNREKAEREQRLFEMGEEEKRQAREEQEENDGRRFNFQRGMTSTATSRKNYNTRVTIIAIVLLLAVIFFVKF